MVGGATAGLLTDVAPFFDEDEGAGIMVGRRMPAAVGGFSALTGGSFGGRGAEGTVDETCRGLYAGLAADSSASSSGEATSTRWKREGSSDGQCTCYVLSVTGACFFSLTSRSISFCSWAMRAVSTCLFRSFSCSSSLNLLSRCVPSLESRLVKRTASIAGRWRLREKVVGELLELLFVLFVLDLAFVEKENDELLVSFVLVLEEPHHLTELLFQFLIV